MIHIKKIDLNISAYNIYKDMTCHPKNAFYVKRWREKYREHHLELNRVSSMKHYRFFSACRVLQRIDPTLFD